MQLTDIVDREKRHIVQTYRRAPVAFARGSGVRLYDVDGREYLDLVSGIGVASLGHADPILARAIAAQAGTLLHCSNLYFHELQGAVAERLAALSGLPRAFFTNSGTEAVEACLKFARRYWHTRGDQTRRDIVALAGSFHGRTYGSLSLTWDEHYRAPFAPLLPGVRFVKTNDAGELLEAVGPSTAAIIVEPIQGEGGVRPLAQPFADALAEACRRTGALLIADEVQCGLGRTGRPFYFQALGLEPALVAVGKALGGGVPVGAALVSEQVAGAIAFGDHGTTYGGNLLACTAALVFLQRLTEGGLMERAARLEPVARERLERLKARHPAVVDVRGAGLMWGIELVGDATPVVDKALEKGLIVNRTATKVIRLLPALVIEEQDLAAGLDLLDAVVAEAGGERAA